ncbi:hypothetical protein DL96DRAFT_1593304 [Flagelloscypha sp. PMI_526]|nr:hypothetical protein DL96DRAFT_1593304 [Flagelloscypha sp. PMI_526]
MFPLYSCSSARARPSRSTPRQFCRSALSFKTGSPCNMTWTADNEGVWMNMTISLMSGSNDNMTVVTTVADNVDGTSLSSYPWTCPEVTPYSAIYFYQFSNGDDKSSSKWTTRFTITSADGKFTPPEHVSQPNGESIPWGSGSLATTTLDLSNMSSISNLDDSNSSSTSASYSESPTPTSRMHKTRPTAQTWDPDNIIPLSMPPMSPQDTNAISHPQMTGLPPIPWYEHPQNSKDSTSSGQWIPQIPYTYGNTQAPYAPRPGAQLSNDGSKNLNAQMSRWLLGVVLIILVQ